MRERRREKEIRFGYFDRIGCFYRGIVNIVKVSVGRRIICDDFGSVVNFLNALDDNHFVPSFKFIKYAVYFLGKIYLRETSTIFLTSLMELYFKRSF